MRINSESSPLSRTPVGGQTDYLERPMHQDLRSIRRTSIDGLHDRRSVQRTGNLQW